MMRLKSVSPTCRDGGKILCIRLTALWLIAILSAHWTPAWGMAFGTNAAQWYADSDLVCVAAIGNSATVASAPEPGRPGAVPLLDVEKRATVAYSLKGTSVGSITVRFVEVDWGRLGSTSSLSARVTLISGGTYLLFLRHTGSQEIYEMLSPTSAVRLSTSAYLHPPANTGLAALASLLTSELKDSNSNVALDSLDALGDVIYEVSFHGDAPNGPVRLPGAAEAKSFVGSVSLPVINNLVTSPDLRIRGRAIEARGMYGDVGSIRTICNSAVGEPALVSDVALALGEFSFRAAVPELTECLKSQWPKIREQVVTNLSEIGDQRALPFLIDALSDSSADVSYSAASALYAITNEMPVCARSDFPTQQASYVRHWSLWASNHKRSLDQLRSLVQRQLNDADSNAAR